jgi:hypothetical protein
MSESQIWFQEDSSARSPEFQVNDATETNLIEQESSATGRRIVEQENSTLSVSYYWFIEEAKRLGEKMESLLPVSHIIWGEYSELDRFIIDNADNPAIGTAIQNIYRENTSNEDILEKLLNALSEVPYDKASQWGGDFIAYAGLMSKSFVANQKAVEAYSNWKSRATVGMLSDAEEKLPWLKKYISKVITKISAEA